MIWCFEDPGRSRLEREGIARLSEEAAWFRPIGARVDQNHLWWDAEITVDHEVYPVSLRYPKHFPHAPPSVLPRGRHRRWSNHQYGDSGELCLEYGPDNWHPDITGADMLRSAYRLLAGERAAEQSEVAVPSRDRTSLGCQLNRSQYRFYATRQARCALACLSQEMPVWGKGLFLFNQEASVVVLSTLDLGTEVWQEALPDPLKTALLLDVCAIRLGDEDPELSAESLPVLARLLSERDAEAVQPVFIVAIRGVSVSAYDLNEKTGTLHKLAVALEEDSALRFDEAHAAARDKRVALVGCGSMGSKVGTSLARCGVGNFILLDEDVFLLENLVRNDLDWRDVGRHKADALAAKLQLVNSTVRVHAYKTALGGQSSNEIFDSLLGILGGCDLLIDATASSDAFNALSAAAVCSKRPLVWGEVFGGGYGGLIGRSRPGHDPGPAAMRQIIEAWCAAQGRPTPKSSKKYAGEDDMPFVADDAEISIVAGHLTRFALDALIRADSQYPHSVYMIGLGAGWIFDEPFQTYSIDVGSASDEHPASPVDPDVQRTEILHLLQLLSEYPDGTADLTTDSPEIG